jgi:hypothetical protein
MDGLDRAELPAIERLQEVQLFFILAVARMFHAIPIAIGSKGNKDAVLFLFTRN